MKFTPYASIIKTAKEAKDSLLAPVRANEMKKKAELEMARIESQLVEADSKIQQVCSEYPINFENLISRIDEKAFMERKKKQFQKILDEMFPD